MFPDKKEYSILVYYIAAAEIFAAFSGGIPEGQDDLACDRFVTQPFGFRTILS